ncbi:glycosyltransferase family 2 protein [Rhizosphaericola mali]|uniref:Glycosyltransferase n=1 Tax=Rhizosphaericola mali TaxID=2545455 RepID=A0A5P2G4X7_9BACT|nr:glycosyltransferase [Rhizosphaericola mali]QES89199.1 glycosyltransferase [Rhizosphaericola mali]
MEKKYLLSICIPTYNRAITVIETVTKIVEDEGFDQDVELIISDNCSTDNTQDLLKPIVDQYPNVSYYRNSENVRDRNFQIALSYGNGHYLKLQNDYNSFTEGSLNRIKNDIRENLNTGIPIFFTGNTIRISKKREKINCNSLNEYIQNTSGCVTFISNFGAFSIDFNKLKDLDKYFSLMLQQDDWSYQIVSNSQKCVVYNYPIYHNNAHTTGVRRGYNWFEVHMDNYYEIMLPYLYRGQISARTFSIDKRNLLLHFTNELQNTFIYNYDRRWWQFETKGTFKILWKYYKNDFFFYTLFPKILFQGVCKLFPRFILVLKNKIS